MTAACLVLADPTSPDATARAVGAAREIAARVELVETGAAPAEDAAPALAQHLRDGGYTHLLAPATAHGKDLAPRAAALLGAPIVSGVSDIRDAGTVLVRPIHAGAVLETVRAPEGGPVVLTVRTHAFSPAQADKTTALAPASQGLSNILETKKSDGPDLASAPVVVAGGKPLGSAQSFALVSDLAAALGGAPGATRDATDAGYAPNAWQVGQTGTAVAPRLYIGAGVSGAIQHVCGMRDAAVVVAINTDPAAPLCQIADYVLEADLFETLPALTSALRKA